MKKEVYSRNRKRELIERLAHSSKVSYVLWTKLELKAQPYVIKLTDTRLTLPPFLLIYLRK